MSLKDGEDDTVGRAVAGLRKVVTVDERVIAPTHSLTCDPMYIRMYMGSQGMCAD